MKLNCCICDREVGIDPGLYKWFRHTWTKIDGKCQYVTICDSCWEGREWCLPTAEEQKSQEKRDGTLHNRRVRHKRRKK